MPFGTRRLGGLVVPVTASLKGYERTLKDAQNKALKSGRKAASNFASSFSKIKLGLGTGLAALGVGGGVGAFVSMAKDSLQFADAIGKTADKLGISTKELQSYRFAAQKAGVEVNQVDTAIQRFTRRIAEAAKGTGEAKGILEEMGITVTDNQGKLKSTSQLFREVSDGMAKLPTQAERIRASFKFFDTEGVALVNLFGKGSEALGTMLTDAEKAGVVIENSVIRRSEEAVDRFTELQARLNKVKLEAALENIEGIEDFEKAKVALAGGAGTTFSTISKALKGLGTSTSPLNVLKALPGAVASPFDRGSRASAVGIGSTQGFFPEISKLMKESVSRTPPPPPAQVNTEVEPAPPVSQGGPTEAQRVALSKQFFEGGGLNVNIQGGNYTGQADLLNQVGLANAAQPGAI